MNVVVPAANTPRMSVAAAGAMLMVACPIAAWGGGQVVYSAWLVGAGFGQKFIVIPFLLLTGLFVLFAGLIWARGFRVSVAESLSALLIIELIIFSVVALVAGLSFDSVMFLAIISLAFAPWWGVGVWIGRPRR